MGCMQGEFPQDLRGRVLLKGGGLQDRQLECKIIHKRVQHRDRESHHRMGARCYIVDRYAED